MKNLKMIVPLLLLVCVIVGGFYFLSNRETDGVESEQQLTEVQELITKDFTVSYPSSPRMVVNYYSRILAVLYNEEYTDEQFEALLSQMRALMSEDLLSANPEKEFVASMKADVEKNREIKRTIRQYTIPDSDEVEYTTKDGKDYASLIVDYRTSTDGAIKHSYQSYILEQDEQGDWKIYGYKLSPVIEEEE